MPNSIFAFWNFLEFIFQNIFYLRQIESMNMDTEGWLYRAKNITIYMQQALTCGVFHKEDVTLAWILDLLPETNSYTLGMAPKKISALGK